MVEARDKEWRKKEPSLREVTQKYKDGRGATLRFGQLLMRLFAELL